jgi:hypothetical protein
MTWLLLAFTGWAVTITNQYNTPYCVAHWLATTATLMGYETDYNEIESILDIPPVWYRVSDLPQAITW